MISSKTFFTEEQKKAIDAAVSEAEKATSGEIVPVLASSSGAYAHGAYHAAISSAVFATFAVFGVHFLLHQWLEADVWEIPVYVLVPAQAVALFAGFYLARSSPRFLRAFLPRALLQRHVDIAARRAFRALDIAKTQGGTGIMLYVSLFERVAVVLADKGIAAKAQQSTWDGVRDLLIAGLRQGDGAGGFTRAIAECGKILAKDFPPGAENPNELPNQLRIL
ncbi:MAG TPA: hypothetical protein VFF73_03450 [Planctomycetota bacterium]|nr:hypothetical protein [Planctomycetota bacterium]